MFHLVASCYGKNVEMFLKFDVYETGGKSFDWYYTFDKNMLVKFIGYVKNDLPLSGIWQFMINLTIQSIFSPGRQFQHVW